jgi:hypothetical protein
VEIMAIRKKNLDHDRLLAAGLPEERADGLAGGNRAGNSCPDPDGDGLQNPGGLPSMPHWIWVCMQACPDRELQVGEVFVLMLDRLAEYGLPARKVAAAMRRLGEAGGIGGLREAGELLGRDKGDAGHERLWKLAAEIPGRIAEAAPCEPAFSRFRSGFGDLTSRFHRVLLDKHPKFFERYGWPEQVHLGGMVASAEWLDRMNRWLRHPDPALLDELPVFRRKEAVLLFDWDGDAVWMMQQYWNEEWKSIMGVE